MTNLLSKKIPAHLLTEQAMQDRMQQMNRRIQTGNCPVRVHAQPHESIKEFLAQARQETINIQDGIFTELGDRP